MTAVRWLEIPVRGPLAMEIMAPLNPPRFVYGEPPSNRQLLARGQDNQRLARGQRLGEDPPLTFDAQAWGTYLKARNDSLSASWARTKSAYFALKKVREDLGKPFIVDVITEQQPTLVGAWSTELDQQIVDLNAMVLFINAAVDEALKGKRQMVWDPDKNDLVLGRLPADAVHIDVQNGVPVLVANSDNTTIVHTSGTVGIAFLALPPLAIVAIVGAVALGVVAVVEKVCDTFTNVAVEKTAQTIAEKNAELIKDGKMTPAQAVANTKAIYDGAKGVTQARAAAAASNPVSKAMDSFSGLITGVMVVAGIGLVVQVLGMLPKPQQRAATA